MRLKIFGMSLLIALSSAQAFAGGFKADLGCNLDGGKTMMIYVHSNDGNIMYTMGNGAISIPAFAARVDGDHGAVVSKVLSAWYGRKHCVANDALSLSNDEVLELNEVIGGLPKSENNQ
jgi:hypothetical protein